MQISVDIRALRDKVLCDDPNESSAIYYLTSDNKHTVCGTDFSRMQINFFAKNISDDSSLWRRFSITCQARKKINLTFRDVRNRHTMIFKVEQELKLRKGTLQCVNAFFTKLLSKM